MPFQIALLIAAREWRERFRLLAVAAALGLIPFVAALVPGAREYRGAAIATVAGFLAVAYTCGVALMQGATVVGRELTEKRLSFYFSKPIPAWTIWAGKAMAALGITAVAGIIVALPSYLASPERWREVWRAAGTGVLLGAIALSLVLFFVAHAVSTMVRSRSMLLVLDALLAVATVALAFFIVQPLVHYHVVGLVELTLIALGCSLLAIFAVAPALQLARGRADARRSHVALSRVLWPAVGTVLAIGVAWTLWLTSTTFSSIDALWDLDHASNGRWVVVTGSDDLRLGLPATFLLNTETREAERLTRAPMVRTELSRDGSAVAWIERTELLPRRGDARLFVRRFGSDTVATPITLNVNDTFAINDDASRVAIVDRMLLRVQDVATGRLLASAPLFQSNQIVSMFFVTPSRVRIVDLPRGGSFVRISELDVERRKIEYTGTATVQTSLSRSDASVSADGALMYLSLEAKILDARTGELRATLPLGVKYTRLGGMLNDGTVVITNGARLYVFDRDGRPVREIALPQPLHLAFVTSQIGDDRVVLIGHRGKRERRYAMLVVDIRRGTVETVVENALGPDARWSIDPRLIRHPENAIFAADTGNRLTYWSLK